VFVAPYMVASRFKTTCYAETACGLSVTFRSVTKSSTYMIFLLLIFRQLRQDFSNELAAWASEYAPIFVRVT